VGQRYWVFVFGAHAQFGDLLVLVSVGVV
jgi:hypothetical protein